MAQPPQPGARRQEGAGRRHRQRVLDRVRLRQAFHSLGAELAITYLNDKAKPHVEPLAKQARAEIFLPLDVERPGELEALFDALRKPLGPAWTSWCTRSPCAEGRPAGRAHSTARPRASSARWTSPATRSSAWRSSPRR